MIQTKPQSFCLNRLNELGIIYIPTKNNGSNEFSSSKSFDDNSTLLRLAIFFAKEGGIVPSR